MRVDLLSAQAGVTADGCSLSIRSPWYRSLPLSSIDVELEIDGETVGPERMRLHINDRDYALDELHDLWDALWFVLDAAQLRVRGVAPGPHEVALTLRLRIPYLFDEETGDVFTLRSEERRHLVVDEEAVR